MTELIVTAVFSFLWLFCYAIIFIGCVVGFSHGKLKMPECPNFAEIFEEVASDSEDEIEIHHREEDFNESDVVEFDSIDFKDDDAPNEPLHFEKTCIVCTELPPKIVLDPCGHVNLCVACVKTLCKNNSQPAHCPTCRRLIWKWIKLYS